MSDPSIQPLNPKITEIEKESIPPPSIATDKETKVFANVEHTSPELVADLQKKTLFSLEPSEQPVFKLLKKIAREGEIGTHWEALLAHVDVQKREKVIKLIENASEFILKAKLFEGRIELTIGSTEDEEDEKIRFRVTYDPNKEDAAIIIFNQNIVDPIVPGNYKTLSRSYEVSQSGVKPLLLTKQTIRYEEDEKAEDLRSTRRERTTLITCRERQIPGTPETYAVSQYQSKELTKQSILQKFYPGGNLADAIESGILSDEKKMVIAKKLSETLSKFHEYGLSHNDFRPENVVLDENGNPIVIDFGGTTSPEDPQLATISPKYLPPEMIDIKLMKQYIALEIQFNKTDREYDELSEQLSELEKKISELKKKLEDPSLTSAESARINEEIKELEAQKKSLDTALSKVRDLLRGLDEKTDETLPLVEETINLNGWQPAKNDDYALGITLEKLFGPNPPKEIQVVISGLLKEDPNERMTSKQAFETLSSNQSGA